MQFAPDNQYESFVRLLAAHEGRLKVFLRPLLPRWEDVEEAVQETSIVAWRKFSDFELGTDFAAWLLTIGRFEALKLRRKVFGERLVFQDDLWRQILDEGAAESERLERERRALDACLEKLDSKKRAWLVAAYQPGVKLHEVARANGRPVAGFYKTIQRLRAALLACIEQSLASETGT
jgi:RNA polymerase sigma-70 factor (ECF subfamily)